MGTEVALKVLSSADMQRDVLKSDSSMVKIPELDLELGCGTLGGVYTTVEGLLQKIHTSLRDDNPFAVGDSSELHHSESTEVVTRKKKFEVFLDKLESVAKGEMMPFTLILRDPLGNSFISAPLGSFLPPESDPNITLTDFERTYEENEDFGLNDINTRDYETGVDELYNEPILSDRVTQKWVKGPDHPTFFAKGIDDNTPGGAVLTCSSITVDVQSHSTAVEIGNLTTDNSSNEPVIPDFNKRTFSESDLTLDFIAYEEFSGAKDGYVFRMGAKGLGYYKDLRCNDA
jgi:ZPR1 zinc-finger domain